MEWPAAWRDRSHGDTASARARLPLRRQSERNPVSPAPEIAFLASGGLHPTVLAEASAQAGRLGVTADAALLSMRIISDEDFYRALARHLGVPFSTSDLRLAPGLDTASAAIAAIAPLARWPGGPRWVFALRGRQLSDLPRSGLRDCVITTPRHFEALLRNADPDRTAAEASSTVERTTPGLSARIPVLAMAWPPAAFVAALAALVMWINPGFALALLAAFFWICFGASCLQRIIMLFASLEPVREAPLRADRDLPTYTIIVALYREANMAKDLIAALERLDYPRAKLDIKFVVESDDDKTRDALAQRLPGAEYEIVVAPPGEPRTKPRALNVALPFARGELLTIYDAEDRPHPMQLRQAAAAFAVAPHDVVCLQARLTIDNSSDGAMQALYALDYAALFAVYNRGLAYYDLPAFLGGTSNHFRRDHLVLAGGWDAWNVTEDADLGLRLARQGMRVSTFGSHTDEEAPMTLWGFLRQRTRWMKGWMQTLVVHVRDPKRLWRELGPLRTLSVLAMFAGGVLGPLLWPLFSAIVLWHAWSGTLLHPVGTLAIARSTLICLLVYCGLVALVVPLVAGAIRQKMKRYLFLLPLLPLWQIALCASAWMAFTELFADPYRWAKTEHGLAKRRGPVATAAPLAF